MEAPTAYKDYPNPEATDVTLYLTSGAPKAGGLIAIKAKKQGKETLVDNYSFSGEALARAEITNHRLLYVTPKLTKDVQFITEMMI